MFKLPLGAMDLDDAAVSSVVRDGMDAKFVSSLVANIITSP